MCVDTTIIANPLCRLEKNRDFTVRRKKRKREERCVRLRKKEREREGEREQSKKKELHRLKREKNHVLTE